jgi:hypothetical protein
MAKVGLFNFLIPGNPDRNYGTNTQVHLHAGTRAPSFALHVSVQTFKFLNDNLLFSPSHLYRRLFFSPIVNTIAIDI